MDARMNVLFESISDLIVQARQRVMTSVNIAEVYTKYEIGKYIVDDEQQGEARAQYGTPTLQQPSFTEPGYSLTTYSLLTFCLAEMMRRDMREIFPPCKNPV